MDDKLNRHISKVQTPNDQVYYIVPEAIKNGSYVINSPTLSADTQFVITSQNQVIGGQKDFSTAPRVFVTDHYEPVLTAADVPSSLFMSFSIADATEETVDNIPGYTWDLTEEQFTSLCNPATQSVTVDIVIPGEGDANQHYIFRRDAAALAGVLGAAYFFAVDSSQATTDVAGTTMRLRVYRNVTWLKLRLEALGELASNPVKTINSTAPTEGNISLKTINGNEIVGSGNIAIADNNQTIKGNGTAFSANDAINIVGGGATTVTADTTNKKITISTPVVTDTNQKVKAGSVTFGNNDVVDFVAGSNVTVTGLASGTGAPKITISATDTGATSIETTGGGNVVNSASYDASTRKITLSKGVTALTSHQSIKTLDTTATTAQSTNAGEAITGSGKITLHKVAKTGTYSDLIGKPSLATVATSGSYNDLSDKPTIPAAQVNANWNATSGVAQILNKPDLATVATSGSYDDLSDKPTIPSAVGDLTNDRFVRYDTASQGLSATQKSNARTNIGAGTGNGSVTSVRVQAGTGLSSSQSTAQTGTLNTTISVADGYKLPTTTEWGGKQDALVSGTNIKTVGGNSLLGSGNIAFPADTNQKVKAGTTTFGNDAAVNFVGGGITTVTGDSTNNAITISTPAYTGGTGISISGQTINCNVSDTNQKVKVGTTTFGANDTVNFVGSGAVTVTGDATNDKITIGVNKVIISGTAYTATYSDGVLAFTAS